VSHVPSAGKGHAADQGEGGRSRRSCRLESHESLKYTEARPCRSATAAPLPPGVGVHLTPIHLIPGTRVKARFLATTLGTQMTKWYSGAVVGVHADGTCDVAYEDGDTEKGVVPWFIRPLEPLTVGQQILSRFKASRGSAGGTRWYPAVVERLHADGCVAVRYDDGDVEGSVQPQYVRAMTTSQEVSLLIGGGKSRGGWSRVIGVGPRHQVAVSAWREARDTTQLSEAACDEQQQRCEPLVGVRRMEIDVARQTAAALTRAAYEDPPSAEQGRRFPVRSHGSGYGSEGA